MTSKEEFRRQDRSRIDIVMQLRTQVLFIFLLTMPDMPLVTVPSAEVQTLYADILHMVKKSFTLVSPL